MFFFDAKTLVVRGIAIVAVFASCATFFPSDAFARPSFIPSNADFRVDYDQNTPVNQTGHWSEVADYGDWGQGQCQPGGYECHKWDWVTWWIDGLVSEPSVVPGTYPSYYFNPGDFITWDAPNQEYVTIP